MLKPDESNARVMICVPAASVAGTLTVVQVCQPPVAGTVTDAHTVLGVPKPTCIAPPAGEATRSWTLYAPAVAIFTV